MNYRIVARLLAVIVLTLGLAFLLCAGVGLLAVPSEAESEAVVRFAFCAASAFALSGILFVSSRGAVPRLFRKEALCVIGAGWILASAVGAVPYALIDTEMSLVDGFFESASGLTTTGASVYADVEAMPRSLLFWRAASQWLGGMGVVVFFVAILSFLGAGAKILYSHEASGSTADFEQGRVQSAVLQLWWIYLGLSVACTLVYLGGGMSLYDSLCHMFATVSTGGFSTRNASLAAYESPFLEWACVLFMILGGTSFVLLAQVTRGRMVVVRRSTELRAFLGILAFASVAIAVSLARNDEHASLHETVRASVFQVVSVMTTTGFATTDFDVWPTFPKLALLVLMIVGGCSGSTAGGVKVARIVIAVRTLMRSVEMEFRPRVVRRIRMNGRPIEQDNLSEVVMFLVLVGVLCMCAIPLAALFEPNLSLEGTVGAVFASLFNIGPGFGEIGPTGNYGELHDYTKVFLALLMIMGRLELYAVLVLFWPTFWRRFR
jgi:trk system potassium uptake protein TrkH